MGRKHSKEEVLKSLRSKGCIITDTQPITKHEQKLIMPDKEEVNKLFIKWLEKQPESDRISTGITTIITNKLPKEFVDSHRKLLEPKKLNVNVVVQEPYCINITPANNSLGNGSWGKIDYLVKVHNYRVVRL